MITPEQTRIEDFGSPTVRSPQRLSSVRGDGIGNFIPDRARVRYEVEFDTGREVRDDLSFEKAGPREQLFFDPTRTRAAVVTCGGICPGLNNVIRSAFLELHHNYGVREVYGIRYGFAGLNPAVGQPPLLLTPQLVDDIHEEGGTVLGTSRGPQDPGIMVDFLVERGLDILLCVGGDGTLRGAGAIAAEVARRGLAIAIVGIPKTIDNDVMYVTRTFGVSTAIEKAHEVLDCAHVEARSAFNGVGLVKVMGREAGFIAAGATLASQEVNFTLIPEVPFALEGEDGLLNALRRRLDARHHAVIVVAEGAGQHLCGDRAAGCDASGNPYLADVGIYLKGRIKDHFRQLALPVDVKYFDPSYLIRSVRANSEDMLLCDSLARHAVHAAMSGKTNLIIGLWNGTFTHVPIALAVSAKRRVDPEGRLWTNVLAATGQPLRLH